MMILMLVDIRVECCECCIVWRREKKRREKKKKREEKREKWLHTILVTIEGFASFININK